MIRNILQHHPDRKLYLLGWSLGANLMLRFMQRNSAASKDMHLPIVAAASICCPFDLTLCDHHMRSGPRRFWSAVLSRGLVKMLQRNKRVFVGHRVHGFDLQAGLDARSVRDFDAAVTAPLYGE